MKSRILYLNGSAGMSGDMVNAALLDLGADFAAMEQAVAALDLGSVSLSREKVTKGHLATTLFRVEVPETAKRLRTLAEVEGTLAASILPGDFRERVLAVFGRLAVAESRAHGTALEKVHFHELGSADTIVDVVCAVVGLDSLGVDELLVGPLNVGAGTVRTAHGIFPVPAPATADLLDGFVVTSDGETGEKTTPTGAAIAAVLGRPVREMPAMRLRATGYGAGTADFRQTVNVLQALLGEAAGAGHDHSAVLECTIDDMNPQVYPWLIGRLLEAGALDAFVTPCLMKKGRPGMNVTVVGPPGRAEALAKILLTETTSNGVRRHDVQRTCLPRRVERMDTPWGPVAVKVAEIGDRVRAVPEYEECRRVAEASGRPLIEIMRLLGELAGRTWKTTGDD